MHNSVLFVAPDSEKRQQLFKALCGAGFSVRCFSNPNDVLNSVWKDTPSLILIQNQAETFDSVHFVCEIRKISTVQIVLMLSDLEECGAAEALQAGADSLLPWKIAPSLFLEWIKALFRRISYYQNGNEEGCIFFRGFVFHEKGRYLEYHQQKIRMADKEFDVLHVLLKNAGKQLSSKYIYSQVWGEVFGDISTVGVHIKRIKLKLAQYDTYPFISNIYKAGYVFDKKCLDTGIPDPSEKEFL